MKHATLILTALLLAGCTTVTRTLSYPDDDEEKPLPTTCGVCHSQTVPLAAVEDDLTKPSANIAVWNRSVCANLAVGPKTPYCPNCHYAWMTWFDEWTMSSGNQKSFAHPLNPAITQFPVPPSVGNNVLFEQDLAAVHRTDSLSFWCPYETQHLATIKKYAATHHLKLTISDPSPSMPGQMHIHAEIKLPPTAAAAQAPSLRQDPERHTPLRHSQI